MSTIRQGNKHLSLIKIANETLFVIANAQRMTRHSSTRFPAIHVGTLPFPILKFGAPTSISHGIDTVRLCQLGGRILVDGLRLRSPAI
jgi:hypothetical protein